MAEAEAGAVPPDETEIIRRVLNGERDEYRHLVRACQDRVFSVVMRQVGDLETARELTQEAFVKGYLKLAAFRGEAAFSTWVTRIAINLTNNYFSSRTFRDRKQHSGLQPETHPAPDSQEAAEAELNVRRLENALCRLPAAAREILVLVALERRSYEEAAVILEIPVGTVRSRLHKARALLREQFFRD